MARRQADRVTEQEMDHADVRERDVLRRFLAPDGWRWFNETYPQEPTKPGEMLIPSPMFDLLCIQFARMNKPMPEGFAETDAKWSIREGHQRSLAAWGRRWGWKSSRVARVLAVLRGTKAPPRALPRAGLVYFVGGNHGPIKIGWTIGTADARLRALQTGSPIPLACLATFAGEAWLERRLHAHLAADRHHGEWFDRAAALALIDLLATGWRP